MPIPDFQTLMLPLLRFCADGAEHERHDALPVLAREFALSEAELAELLPSGKQAKFVNRLAWAKSYLKQAALLETTARGVFRITERGRSVLAGNPVRIDMKFLERFPEYQAFRSIRRSGNLPEKEFGEVIQQSTPEELLESGVHKAKKGVFITTSGFNKNARETSAKVDSKIVLIDGPTLTELMIDFGLGVSPVNTYEIKRIDSDFFAED